MKYFSSYDDKKPAVLLMKEEALPPGMTIEDISDLYEKSAPIPYIGDIAPILVEVPKELTGESIHL
jgi:hypothetical protein